MHAITSLAGFNLLAGLKQEPPLYLSAASQAPSFSKTSVDDYTAHVFHLTLNDAAPAPKRKAAESPRKAGKARKTA